MGNQQSSTIRQTIDSVTQNTTNTLVQTTNSAYVSQAASQNMTFKIEPGVTVDCRPGSLQISQGNQTIINLDASFKTQNSSDLIATLQNAITASATTGQKQVSGFLATQIADSQGQTTSIEEHLKSIISTNISAITSNSCIANSSNTQNLTVDIAGNIYSNGCSFGQTFQVQVALHCVADAITNIIAQDSVLNSGMAQAAATQDQTATGPIQEIAGLLQGLFAPFIILLLVGLFVFLLIPRHHGGGGSHHVYVNAPAPPPPP